MKSDVCHLDSGALDVGPALIQVEKCAAYEGLDTHQTLRLRLLGEELMGMVKGILGDYTADFWVEVEDKNYELHLQAKANVSEDKREELLKLSTSGENIAARGFMGKVRQIFEASLYGDDQTLAMVGAMSGEGGGFYDMQAYAFSQAWSLMNYRESMGDNQEDEKWDELEKSIVAKLADDVLVGVRCRAAEIIIKKQFH